jgi:REP element-mobilizing transposase RayT
MYHCISRVVDRQLVLGPDEKERLRGMMRRMEGFSGCRVLAYCLMSNHLHILLEVPPMVPGGLSDADLLKRLGALYPEVLVAEVAKELREAREKIAAGTGQADLAEHIHQRYTYRMHDLGEFMKTLLQRFTRWFNARHERVGVLWESRFKSVLVEEGVAAKTMAAYIDLNPVRAGIVSDPGAYRWSSYGEAMGGGPRGDGRKARAGLVRALTAHREEREEETTESGGERSDGGEGAAQREGRWENQISDTEIELWNARISREYRMLLLMEGEEKLEEVVNENGELDVKVRRKGMRAPEARAELERLQSGRDVALGRMLRFRVRYFTDGAVIGSRGFVDEVFGLCRNRFGPKRKSGARKLRGEEVKGAAAGILWSARDLKTRKVPPVGGTS